MKSRLTITFILFFFSAAVRAQDFGNIYEEVKYTGKVGTSDVVLTIRYMGNVLQGEYYYTKYNKVINFMSKKDYVDESGSVVMYEYIDNGLSNYDDVLEAMKKSTGSFVFSLQDLDNFDTSSKLSGKWVSASTGEKYIVELTKKE